MAFCEMCGTPIPDGQIRCASCSPHKEEPFVKPAPAPRAETKRERTAKFPFENYIELGKEIPAKFKSFSFSDVNWIGIGSLLFLFLTMVLPVIDYGPGFGTWIWELGGRYYFGLDGAFIPVIVVLVFLLSPACYLLRLDKIAYILAMMNFIAFLIVFIPNGFRTFSIGIVFWVLSVIVQLSANLAMRVIDYYVKKK